MWKESLRILSMEEMRLSSSAGFGWVFVNSQGSFFIIVIHIFPGMTFLAKLAGDMRMARRKQLGYKATRGYNICNQTFYC